MLAEIQAPTVGRVVIATLTREDVLLASPELFRAVKPTGKNTIVPVAAMVVSVDGEVPEIITVCPIGTNRLFRVCYRRSDFETGWRYPETSTSTIHVERER